MKNWPADKAERRRLDKLKPYAKNARTHSNFQVGQIARSIEQFGFTVPVLIEDDGTIIAGHGRALAAKELGLKEIPVVIATGWTSEQRKAYAIADNQLTIAGGWDDAILRQELVELKGADFDLALTGFDEQGLAALLDVTSGETDPDAVPETPDDPVSVLGDVWIMGRHRLVCGDCTDATVVDKALNGVKPHLMVTDPPYGVEYDPNWRNEANRWAGSNVKLGASALGVVQNDDRVDWSAAWSLFNGDIVYVWHAALKGSEVFASLETAEFIVRSQIIWDKTRGVIGRGNYHWQHEPCWYAVRKGKTGHWSGDRTQTTVWAIPKSKTSETGHSTQKPIECMKRPIENNSSPGQAVYEPFSGSGTTIIAAEMTGRCCHAIELNPAYIDVAVKRWQDFTKQEAVNDRGETFNSLFDKQSKKSKAA